MNLHEFNQGDILEASDKSLGKGVHYIVFLGMSNDPHVFLGAMLTRQNIHENIPLIANHFCPNFPVTYDNSHIVNRLFVKFSNWGPFTKVGELSAVGLEFVQGHLANQSPITFGSYYRELKSQGII